MLKITLYYFTNRKHRTVGNLLHLRVYVYTFQSWFLYTDENHFSLTYNDRNLFVILIMYIK